MVCRRCARWEEPQLSEQFIHRSASAPPSLIQCDDDRSVDPLVALAELGGAARREQLLVLGVSREAIDCAVAKGHVLRPHRGVSALPTARAEVIFARTFRGQVACVSACDWWGFAMLKRPGACHVAIPTDRSLGRWGVRPQSRVIVHRTALFEPGLLVQTPWAAIDSAAWCTSPLEQLVIVDSALRTGRVDRADLAWLSQGDVRRRVWLRRSAHPAAESVTETVARVALEAAGFAVAVQAQRDDVGRVDLEIDGRVVVELDSIAFHLNKEAFVEDRRRDRAVIRGKGLPLRFTYWDVIGNLDSFVTEVAAVVGRAPDRRTAARLSWMTRSPHRAHRQELVRAA